MNVRKLLVLLITLGLLALTLCAGAEVRYTVTDVGYSYIWGINSSGQYASTDQIANGYRHAFLHDGSKTYDLGTLGGKYSYASAINNLGWVAGAADIAAAEHQSHAFLYDGVMHDLGTLGGLSSGAYDINDSGHVVGYGDTSTGFYHAFLYDGTMHDLGSLPNRDSSYATAINNSGQIVGGSENHDGSSSIGGLPTGNEAMHAFIYSNGLMHDLGSLPGWDNSIANDINDAGQIVGNAEAASMGDGGDDPWRAFLYDGTTMLNLNDLIDPSSGWTLYGALGINNSGQILATGCRVGNDYTNVLLTPVPEPSSMMCLGLPLLGLGCVVIGRRRRMARLISVSVVILSVLVMGALLADDGGEVTYNADPAGGPSAEQLAFARPQLPVTNEPPPGYAVLPAFPHYWWSYGCFPTCGAMIVGYYDNAGFPDMFRQKLGSSDASPNYIDYDCPFGNPVNDNQIFLKTGDDPYMYRDSAPNGSRCAISASEAGVFGRPSTYKGHVDDYVGGSDPYFPVSRLWFPHADDSIADYMGTSISKFRDNLDGETKGYFYWKATDGGLPGSQRRWVPSSYGTDGFPNVYSDGKSRVDGTYGLARYVSLHAGYCLTDAGRAANGDLFDDVVSYYNQPVIGYVSTEQGVTKADIKNAIDSGMPVIAMVVQLAKRVPSPPAEPYWWESGTPGSVSHAVVVYGYKWTGVNEPMWMLIYDTWDEDQRGYGNTAYREVKFPEQEEVKYWNPLIPEEQYHETVTSFIRGSRGWHFKIAGFGFLKINNNLRCDAPLADEQDVNDIAHENAFDLIMTGQNETGREPFGDCTNVRYDVRDPSPSSQSVDIQNGAATIHIDRDCVLRFRTYKDVNAPDGYVASKVVRRVYSLSNANKNVKQYADGTKVTTVNAVVTHVVDSDNFYVEERDKRLFGICVHKTSHGLAVKDELRFVVGTIGTNELGERYIDATDISKTENVDGIQPVLMANKSLGGGNLNYNSTTGAGQRGTTNGVGLNNVGLLVKTTGCVSSYSTSSFEITDGSPQPITVITHSGVSIPESGIVAVTGVCSLQSDGSGGYKPVLLVRGTADIVDYEETQMPAAASRSSVPLRSRPLIPAIEATDTIAWALKQSDGSAVTVKACSVLDASINGLTISDGWTSGAATIRVAGNWAVKQWSTVDVTGVITTLADGTREITASQILVYTDSKGKRYEFPMPFWRAPAGQLISEWPYKDVASLRSM